MTHQALSQAEAPSASASAVWIPIESSSDILTSHLHALGAVHHSVIDVYGTDAEIIDALPSSVCAMIVCMPYHENWMEQKLQQELDLKQKHTEKVWFMYQTIHNACGSVALIHAICNTNSITYDDETPVGKLVKATNTNANATPIQRARAFEAAHDIAELHERAARAGNTPAVPETDDVDQLHYVTLVCVDNTIYEVDGLKPEPVAHGTSTPKTFGRDAMRVIKEYFMTRNPDDWRFAISAIVPNHDA